MTDLDAPSGEYPCCQHCSHDESWGGKETKIPGRAAHTVPCHNCHAASAS